MGFFVPESLEENQSHNKNRETDDKLHLIIIALSKKMGMSFVELNQLRVRDFLETFNIFSGKSNAPKTENNQSIKEANQSDINKFLS